MTARESAFSAFFEAHERRLRAFALRRTHDPVAADDLVAAVMEIAWTKFEEVEAASAFGWLCGVAIRVQANDARVRRRRQANLERLVAEAETRSLAANLDADSLLPEQREAIEAALERIGPGRPGDAPAHRLGRFERRGAGRGASASTRRRPGSGCPEPGGGSGTPTRRSRADRWAGSREHEMSVYVDPLELLARANPVPDERALAPTRAYVPAQRTLERILRAATARGRRSTTAGFDQRRRRRRRGSPLAGAAAAVGARRRGRRVGGHPLGERHVPGRLLRRRRPARPMSWPCRPAPGSGPVAAVHHRCGRPATSRRGARYHRSRPASCAGRRRRGLPRRPERVRPLRPPPACHGQWQ